MKKTDTAAEMRSLPTMVNSTWLLSHLTLCWLLSALGNQLGASDEKNQRVKAISRWLIFYSLL